MGSMETSSLLARGLAALHIEYTQSEYDRLSRYVGEIEKWNAAYGLVNASGDDLVIRHILDSLAPMGLLEEELRGIDALRTGGNGEMAAVSDIGTGAGLPGIPLSIMMPERQFRLIDRMGKRITFLESQKALLPLPNVSITEGEIERVAGPHQAVVFRAFRPFSETKLFRSIWKKLEPGGCFFAYKGKLFNARMELASLELDPDLSRALPEAKIRQIWVPFLEEERCVVLLRKPRD